MKKKIVSLLMSTALLLPSAAFASETSVNSDVYKVDDQMLYKVDDQVVYGKNVIGATAEPTSSVSLSAAAPYYRGETKVYAIGGCSAFSDAFTDYMQGTTLRIDRIYVKAKLYVGGILSAWDTDDQRNASHAGIYAGYGVRIIGDQESIGEHKFEQAGYKIVTLETSDT
ncbi:hypothetical protein D1872_148090 [compost metagenome]